MYSLHRLHHRHTRAIYGRCRLGGVQCSAAATPATTTSTDASASNVRRYIGAATASSSCNCNGFRLNPARSSQEVGHSFTASESKHGNSRWMSSSGSRSVALPNGLFGHQPSSISISAHHHHNHSASQSQATARHRSSSKSFTKNKSKRAYAKHYERGPDMRNCQSIEEIAQMASDSLDNMSPRDLAAFWTLTSKFLQNNTTTNNNHNNNNYRNPGSSSRQGGTTTGVMVKQLHDRDQQSMQIAVLTRQLQSVLVLTMDRINRFRPRDLAQTALGLARIVNAVSGNEKRRSRGVGNTTTTAAATASSSSPHYQILHGLLIGNGEEKDPSSSSSTSNRKDMFFQSIANASMKFLHTFEGQYLCNLAYANAIANTLPTFPHHDGSNLFENIARHSIPLLDNTSDFQPQTFSNMVWAFDKLGVIHPELFEGVAKTIVGMDSLDEFKPQELSNTLLAFANTTIDTSNEGGDGASQHHYAALFDTVAEHIVQLDNLDWFKPQELSNIVWAYAVADKSHPMLFQKIADHILDPDYNLKRFKPKDLCSTVWAFAKTQQSHPMLFETVAHEILALNGNRLWHCDPPQLSMIVWAYAKDCEGQHWHQQPYHAEIFTKVAEHMMIRLDKLENGFMISNILWAYTKTLSGEQKQGQGTVNNQLSDKMAKYIMVLDNVEEEIFNNPYSISTTLWAFAKSGSSNSKLFEKAEKHILALDSLEGFKQPQDLSNIAWAFSTAKGRPKNQRLFKKIADQVVSLLGSSSNSFEPRALSNLMWAYANANIFHPHLLDAIANEVIARHSEFNSQEVSNLLWAYASLGKLDPGLFESLESTVVECLVKCNSQELANIAWAYSVANANASTLFGDESLFVDICNQKVEEFTFEELGQLHQWNLWRKELQSEISLPSLLETRCYNAFKSVTPTHSSLQQQVVSELESIGLQPQEEVLMKTTGYRIDALVEVNGNTIGVEVDGPSHFIDREPTGNTLLKRREVTNLDDIQLVSVPYWEWNDVKDDDTKKQGYLRSLLGLQ